MYLSPRKKLWVDTATEMFGAGSIVSKSESIEDLLGFGVPAK